MIQGYQGSVSDLGTLPSRSHSITLSAEGKNRVCLGCQGVQIGPRSQSQKKVKKRSPLGQLDGDALNRRAAQRKTGTHTRWECDVCDVAICTGGECWYFYHRQNN